MVGPYIKLTYGQMLRLYRNKQHYTVKYVAGQLGVTADTIRNYENDQTIPSYYNIKKLEKLYGSEFEKISEHMMSENGNKPRKLSDPMILRLEAPEYIYHGYLDQIIRGMRKPEGIHR